MRDFEKFKQKVELQRPAENTKVAVIIILVLSLGLFTIIGKEATKSIILYWAAFMTILMLGCAIQDILINKKVKRLDSLGGK